ncbi:PQQ-binding-like beta-propeller repeat protein [Maioricimonas sp. JC845]|uniref:beta-propeller domain-containing protein n=1 Tax=Maioricimonas sp. JC845 TaxID=3232138 RepID=UPI003459EC08
MRRFSVALLAVLFLSQSLAGPLQAAGRRFLAADSSKKTLALIDEDGQTVWQHQIGPLHDLHQLADGHILCQLNWTRVVEIDPATDEIVWEYDAATANGNEGKKVEVHAFQRLADGNTMIVESGPARIIEVAPNGQIAREIPLKVENPHPHRDTRLVRKLDSGNYLVCHEGDGVVREYDATGAVVWDFPVPLFGRQRRKGHGLEAYGNQCFAALRLKNGNTLISTGNGHGIIEVTPAGKVVWQLQQDDLPGIRLAWVTTLEVLPGGNIVIGNCHAGPDNPQLIEITRDKEVVWTFHDFKRFGNALTNSQILAIDGKPVRNSVR